MPIKNLTLTLTTLTTLMLLITTWIPEYLQIKTTTNPDGVYSMAQVHLYSAIAVTIILFICAIKTATKVSENFKKLPTKDN